MSHTWRPRLRLDRPRLLLPLAELDSAGADCSLRQLARFGGRSGEILGRVGTLPVSPRSELSPGPPPGDGVWPSGGFENHGEPRRLLPYRACVENPLGGSPAGPFRALSVDVGIGATLGEVKVST